MKWIALSWTALMMAAGASPRLDFARGVLAEQRGDAAAADEAFERARGGDPVAFFLTERVAARRRAAGDIEGASTLYREFAAAHPRRLEAQLAYADFLRESSPQDDFAAKMARDVLERAGENFPASLPVKRRLFRIFESLGQRDRSMALFEELASPAASGSEAMAAVGMARTLFSKDDAVARERVDALYRKAMAESPASAGIARAASEHFRTSGRLAEAVEILTAHVAAAPSSLDLRVRRGILLLAAERHEEGEEALREVLAIDPRHALAHQALAKLLRKQDRVLEALPHAAELLKIRGGAAADFLGLADEFLAVERPREARLLLEKSVFFHPGDAGLRVKLAIAARRDPASREKAARLFREAELLSEDDGPAGDPEFLREFAESLLEGGQISAAEERLRRAIRAYPADRKAETAAALRRLAGIWRQQNRNEEAAKALIQRAESLESRQR